PGMALGDDGTIRWKVPAGFTDKEVDVILSASDPVGQDVFQTFRLAVVEKDALPREVAADMATAGPASERKLPARPAPPSFTVHRPKEEKVEVPLPPRVDDVVVGGGGRYLLLHQPNLRKISVFDVQQGKVAGEVSLTDVVARYAADATRLVVLYPRSRTLQV